VAMCTVLLPLGGNVYCTTATGWQCVLYYCHRVAMCTVLLPPGDNPNAVNKYININNVFQKAVLAQDVSNPVGRPFCSLCDITLLLDYI
jgi:hypothetical protein